MWGENSHKLIVGKKAEFDANFESVEKLLKESWNI